MLAESRCRSLRPEKSDVGPEYSRTWSGWHHHVGPVMLGGAFLLNRNRLGGKKMPRITRPQVYRVVREMPPANGSGQPSCNAVA